MKTVVIKGRSVQIISTLGPKDYNYYMLWALWIPLVRGGDYKIKLSVKSWGSFSLLMFRRE